MRWFLKWLLGPLNGSQSRSGQESYVDPGGMMLVASSGPLPDRSKLGEVTSEIQCVAESGEHGLATCGHKAAAELTFNVYGSEIGCQQHHACVDCAIDELRENIIRCALCGHAILPGSPVAVYGEGTSAEFKDVAHTIDGGGMLGCLAWDCCPSGGFFAGHWMGAEQGFEPYDFESSTSQ